MPYIRINLNISSLMSVHMYFLQVQKNYSHEEYIDNYETNSNEKILSH